MLQRFLAALLGLALVAPVSATSVLPLYLDEIIDHSELAFEGTCLGNRTEQEPGTNLVVTYTTFAVQDLLKGHAGATHVIKQIGGRMPGDTVRFEIEGVPKFAPGESYVVFLAGVSSRGFSSPIGLAQGRFGIKRGPTGARVGNGRDFRDMTGNIPERDLTTALGRALQKSIAPERDLALGEFKQLVRERAQRAK